MTHTAWICKWPDGSYFPYSSDNKDGTPNHNKTLDPNEIWYMDFAEACKAIEFYKGLTKHQIKFVEII